MIILNVNTMSNGYYNNYQSLSSQRYVCDTPRSFTAGKQYSCSIATAYTKHLKCVQYVTWIRRGDKSKRIHVACLTREQSQRHCPLYQKHYSCKVEREVDSTDQGMARKVGHR